MIKMKTLIKVAKGKQSSSLQQQINSLHFYRSLQFFNKWLMKNGYNVIELWAKIHVSKHKCTCDYSGLVSLVTLVTIVITVVTTFGNNNYVSHCVND